MNTLEFLISFENDCLCFYKTLAAGTTDPELKELYQLLEAPHYFLEWGEFSNLHPL